MKIRVLLADDHELVRAGIRSLLEKMTGVQVVAEAGNGREALELTKRYCPMWFSWTLPYPNQTAWKSWRV